MQRVPWVLVGDQACYASNCHLAWQLEALDLLGILPGGEYPLVVIDYFSSQIRADVVPAKFFVDNECLEFQMACLNINFACMLHQFSDYDPNLVLEEMDTGT